MTTQPLTLVSSESTSSDEFTYYPPGSTEAKLKTLVEGSYKKIKEARKGTERQWYINLAFVLGRQNVAIQNTALSSAGFRLYVPKAPPWRVRLVINHVRRIVRREMASIFSQKPRFEVVPSTTEDADLIAARAGEQIFDSYYDRKDLKAVLKSGGWWALVTGTGFYKCNWDPGAVVPGQEEKGDICTEAITPFHLFVPDFRSEDLEGQPFVIHATTKDPQWVMNVFKKKVSSENVTNESILEDSFLGMMGTQSLSSSQVLVLEAWFKPGATNLLPEGGVVTIVGGKVAQVVDKYPYEHGMFPFGRIVNIPSGKFYGESVVTDLIPVQKELNRTRSQITEAKNLMAKPKLLAAKGSIDPSKVTSEPGQVVLYTPGFNPPTPLQMPELPGYVVEQVAQLRQDMDDLSGIHAVSSGQNPSQVTSATALSFLQEQDDTMLTDTTDSIESCIQKIGRMVLGYAAQYWSVGRMVKTTGTDGAFDAQVYKGSDLRGNTDLRVEAGSALPKSKAARLAFLSDMMKQGLIPPQDGLEMMELAGIEKIYDDVLADKRAAQRENIKMAAKQPLQPAGTYYINEWDNHQLHIKVHNRFRKSQTFELLDEEAQTIFQNHVKAHQAAAILQANGDPTGSGQVDNGLPPTAEEQQQQTPPGMPPPEDPNSSGMPGPEGAPPANMDPNAQPPVGGP
jgi:hypothetical protein